MVVTGGDKCGMMRGSSSTLPRRRFWKPSPKLNTIGRINALKDKRIALIAGLNSQWNMTWSDRNVQETISYATHIAPIFKHCFLPIEEALPKLNDFLQCRSLDGFVSYKHAIASNKIERNLWDEETRLET
jgi:hypothetical protein